MRFVITASMVATVVLTAATAASAFEKELAAYQAATAKVCQRGVTPQMQAKYEALVAAVDEAKYGFGRTGSPSNFWGPQSPQKLFEQCQQSGGDASGGSD